MPIKTPLSNPPYGDTVPVNSDYYRVLTKPSVSLQSRELIELQTMFATQIERLSDNLIQPGSVVSGCNFLFLAPYPYIKIEDQDVFGVPVTPSSYSNLTILNPTTGLRAHINDTADGYVSTDPDLKTLYVNYFNTGFDSNTTAFSSGDVLTVYDSIRNGIERVQILSGGQGFSNTTQLFGVSAIAITPVSGTISNGQYIVNGLGANLQVVGVDTVTMANSGQTILKIAPRAVDLANVSVNATAWTLANGQAISTSGNTATATVSGVIGYGYQGLAVTDSLGSMTQVLTLNKGFGYTTAPYVTMRSANNVSGYGTLSLSAENFVAKITVASTSNAVGNGYAFGVSEGVTYLNGTHLRVSPQTVIVSKYSDTPNGVSAVFSSVETIVTSDIDPLLEDPAAGKNNGAPGADRLKITPILTIVPTANADSNSSVVSLVEWNEGNPYVQRQSTQYSEIGSHIAQTVSDQSGDFYIDPFLVTTATSLANDNPNTSIMYFDVVVDAGSAYIGGYKVQTSASYVTQSPFSYVSAITPFTQTLNYGSYLRINQLGGTFQFNTGDQVQLYSTAKGFASNTTLVKTQNTNPVGTLLGTARIRGLSLESGVPGSPTAVYDMYLFDVVMNAGANFGSVRSIYYNGTNKGIADAVLGSDSNGNQVCQLNQTLPSSLVWQTPYASIKNVNAASYAYSALDQTVTIANSGVLTKSLASLNQTFPWSGVSLTSAQMSQLVLVPTSGDLVSSVNVGGTWVINTATANLVANSGTSATTDLVAGDWIYLVGNSTQSDLKQVVQVTNSSFIVLDSAPGFANTAGVTTRAYPKNLPIPLGSRSGTSANVSSNGTVLSINVGFPIAQSTSANASLAVPIQLSAANPTSKTVNRKGFVKINCANNAGGTSGPWCLGVPDVFRLRSVFVGNSSVDSTGTDYASLFSIDNNQNTDFLDLSWLYLDTGVNSPLSGSSYILVEFDWFSPTGSGYFATPSYTQTSNVFQVMITDATPLANLTNMASTWEIPELFTTNGGEIDLTQCVDFRPTALATVTPTSTPASAPVDPSNVVSFSTSEKYFPLPGTSFSSTVDFYVPRIDTVYVTPNGTIGVLTGTPLYTSGSSTPNPAGTMKIADILVPQYPDLPANRSVSLVQVLNTGIVNTRYSTSRFGRHSITLLNSITQDAAKVYTNKDIADLDRRLKNVEYTVNLNQLETATQTTVIPSSSDPSVNRYQYGFFADDFTTNDLMDRTNPTYAASMENTDIVPAKMTWEVYMGDEFSGSQPYITQSLISQLNATIGTHGDPTAVPQCAISLANTIAFQTVYRTAFDYNGQAPQDGTTDVISFTLADNSHMTGASAPFGTFPGTDAADPTNLGSSTVTLWFYAYDNPIQFQILQGNTVVADSSTATALSANDVMNLTTGTALNQWFNDQTQLYLKNPVVVSGSFVEFAGKIGFNYSGTGSRDLTIRTTNGTGTRNWRWVLSYPVNGDSVGCTPPPPNYSCPDGYTFDFTTMGCVINPPHYPPPIRIDWTGCGNALSGFYQYLQRVIASGASMSTVVVADINTRTGVNSIGDVEITGTLADWLNPVSTQSIWLIQNDVALSGWGGHGNLLAAEGTAASNLIGGYYYLNPNQNTVYYVAPNGSQTAINVNTDTSGIANGSAYYQNYNAGAVAAQNFSAIFGPRGPGFRL